MIDPDLYIENNPVLGDKHLDLSSHPKWGFLFLGKAKMGFKKGNYPINKADICEPELVYLYTTKRISGTKLAEMFDVNLCTIYNRLRALGIKIRSNSESHVGIQARENNPNWKGGESVDGAGYVTVNINGKQFRKHRIIAEQKLGRELMPNEVVHHIDGDIKNNHPENIEILSSQSEHIKKHINSKKMSRRGKLGAISRWKISALEAAGKGGV